MRTVGEALAAGFTRLDSYWKDADGDGSSPADLTEFRDQPDLSLEALSKRAMAQVMFDAVVVGAAVIAPSGDIYVEDKRQMVWGEDPELS